MLAYGEHKLDALVTAVQMGYVNRVILDRELADALEKAFAA